MKRLLLGACALFSVSAADAALNPVSGTTCGGANTIADLGNGIYDMPGLDRSHGFVTWGGGVRVVMDNISAVPLLFAVCTDPPSPTASCTVFRVEAQRNQTVNQLVTRPAQQQNIWVVVDSPVPPSAPDNCGNYSITVFDNGN